MIFTFEYRISTGLILDFEYKISTRLTFDIQNLFKDFIFNFNFEYLLDWYSILNIEYQPS